MHKHVLITLTRCNRLQVVINKTVKKLRLVSRIFKFPFQRRCQFCLGYKMSSEIRIQLPVPNDVETDKELCPVCREREIRTRFLPCIHMICEPCLQDLIKCSEGNTFKCPLCRKEYYVDTFAPVKTRQYGEQNNHYAETSFSSQGILTTISERVEAAGDRRLADRVIRSNNGPAINQRPQTYSYNKSECVCCRSCIKAAAFGVCMLHLILVAIARVLLGLFSGPFTSTWNGCVISQMLKGASDFIIAITLWRNVKCRYRTHFIWTECFFGDFLGWYIIVDWLMIFCITLYMYCLVKDD
ncbi:uncharacterized protein LOC132746564 isoform X2 [Ruditapes philippinarum]|uniref:uncharacterized protein LOC132746564 isoform X2 n=1 Tax=Ruditapes philippinarum TaxID=129788 RepID=UPI00295AAB78|nr:uncharacterized protein LOC132746564 isoform X2 [Ruditapes philippinarum]